MSKIEKKPALPMTKRNVKHTFTTQETSQLHTDFRQAYSNLKAVESEFDSVKASYKAKTTEAQSRMDTLNATLQAGFEMRFEDCFVLMRPEDKKKDFYIVPDDADERLALNMVLSASAEVRAKDGVKPDLTEDMTTEDFEQDLLQADQEFENRSDVELWAAESDRGRIVVGKLRGKWYTAIRGNVGGQRINERLDGEQKCFKLREDAIGVAGRRAMEWLESALGKDAAKGFADAIVAALESEKGKVE